MALLVQQLHEFWRNLNLSKVYMRGGGGGLVSSPYNAGMGGICCVLGQTDVLMH
jgi:hypothetical protein